MQFQGLLHVISSLQFPNNSEVAVVIISSFYRSGDLRILMMNDFPIPPH